jgi:hypothetical protein
MPSCRRRALLSSLPAASAVLAIRGVRCGSGAAPFSLYARRAAAPALVLRRASLQTPCAAVSRASAVLAIRDVRCGSGSTTPFSRCTRGALRLRSRFCAVSHGRRCELPPSEPAPFPLYIRDVRCGSGATPFSLYARRAAAPILILRRVLLQRRLALLASVPAPFSLYAACAAVFFVPLAIRDVRCGSGAAPFSLCARRYAACAAVLALRLSRCTRGALRLRF